MSKQDALTTKFYLDRAKEASKPLKDLALERKITEGIDHITKKIDPKQGG